MGGHAAAVAGNPAYSASLATNLTSCHYKTFLLPLLKIARILYQRLSLLTTMIIFWLIALVIALSVHEYAHARLADELGDPTPRLAGRLTLNPLAHLDFIGTLALLLIHFGWGKPVPIDPFNLRHPRRDEAIIALAGPASNLLTALAAALLFRLLNGLAFPSFWSAPTAMLLEATVILNLGLGIFNLIPLPPLDGSKILLGLLPAPLATSLEETLQTYSLIILLIILFLPLPGGGTLVDALLGPFLYFASSLLLGSPAII